ncbi:hypothetical protein JTB14_029052 [Gonioctena quinquepunctata]|nr:hypothetical protein JTB14_029052 [Gonioctena quinquepunctata]
MEGQSYSAGKYLKSDKIMDKFNTVFGQAENYNMDRNSKIIPTPKYLMSLMECRSYSVGKYMESNKVENGVEYLEMNQAVKKVLWCRTRMAKHHQQKSKALARILAKSITKAVARSMKYGMLMKTTLSSQYEFKYKSTKSAIEKLIPISEEMSQIER